VRLIPEVDAVYEWDYLPERQHLFRKQISKHNIAAYKEIKSEIGESIVAIRRGAERSMTAGNRRTESQSFSSIITELRERIGILSSQLAETKQVLEARDETVAFLSLQVEQHIKDLDISEQRTEAAQSKLKEFQTRFYMFQEEIVRFLG
jgi:DNA polymerase III alpha subunit (gram-positive type)